MPTNQGSHLGLHAVQLLVNRLVHPSMVVKDQDVAFKVVAVVKEASDLYDKVAE